jgi:hypothetical protein
MAGFRYVRVPQRRIFGASLDRYRKVLSEIP